MKPTLTPELRLFRQELRDLLARPVVAAELAAIAEAPPEDCFPAAVYQLLGAHQMLAPAWPRRYGGRDATAAHAAIVQEELSGHGVPDMPFINTITNAGSLLQFVADAEQKARFLPPLAAGTDTMVVLYTEPEAGSDLASLRTRAERVDGGWRLYGSKWYAVQVRRAAYAVVAARTSERGRAEAGITLFVVALAAPGVEVGLVDSLYPDPFCEVLLDGVHVPDSNVLGPVDGGWFVLAAGLAIERTGVDYIAKASSWLATVARQVEVRVNAVSAVSADDAVLADRLVDLQTQAAAGRVLAWRLVERQQEGDLNAEEAAMAKWFNSELCVKVARLALDAGGLADGASVAMLREAPGLTLSAGGSEIMLEIIASSLGLGADVVRAQPDVAARPGESAYSAAFHSGTIGAPYAVVEQTIAAESLAAHGSEEVSGAASPVALLIQDVAVGSAGWLLAVDSPLVLYSAGEVTRRPLRSLSDEELHAVDVGPATGLVVCDKPDCPACTLTLARLRSQAGAYLCGLTQGAIAAAVRRVQTRLQFGRPIGTNQAVAFTLAALTARLAAVHALGEHVATLIESDQADAGTDPLGDASRLLAACAELAVEATTTALHLHGAFGLRSDQDAQRFYRRACAVSVRHGTPAQLRAAGSPRREGSR
ncbi:acyl-CoA dehydrogenase family protein [Actinokineospora inagensis]|uniref:acyl-CoA dehydrogenase family protein n=1 Tax=Actinokineospora inagensis TaxID=103730 RepID=UPI0003F792A1|nr:acyl-CoA dehydrogenase family protein [Actinokineospora inagensis]